MKIANFFMMTLLVGTLGVLGCDSDSTGTGGTAGSGGTGGTGGVIPEEYCDVEICALDSDVGRAAMAACINEINDCLALGESTTEQCIAFGVETCTG
jgi:hypothetical protein